MTLDNFDNSFPANRLKNGLAYFKSGKVTSLEQDDAGDWTATVSGTEEYDVEIIMDGHKIDETSCTCPSHDEDDQCKHVAAVLYAIREQMDGEEGDATDQKNTEMPDNITRLLEELRPEELRFFLTVKLKGDKTLRSSFETIGEYLLAGRGADDLAKALTAEIDKFEQDGSIAKKHIPAIIKLGNSWVDTAAMHWEKKEIAPALDHLFAVTEILPFESSFIEDEQGEHHAVIRRAFELIDKICANGELSESITGQLTDRAFIGAADPDVSLVNYDLHWLDLILRHHLAEEREDEFIEILDNQLEANTGKENEKIHARLLRVKVDFLGISGQKREAMKIVQENPNLANEQEQLLIAASQKKGEYKVIKQKLLAELELAQANGNKQECIKLQKLIIELLTNTSDVLDLRKLSERFYLETGDPLFFDAMRGTYTNATWEQVKSRFGKGVNKLRSV